MLSCADLCFDESCKSFGWSATSGTCVLYGRFLQNMRLQSAASGDMMFYHIQCFKKSCSRIPSTVPTNCVCTETSTCQC